MALEQLSSATGQSFRNRRATATANARKRPKGGWIFLQTALWLPVKKAAAAAGYRCDGPLWRARNARRGQGSLHADFGPRDVGIVVCTRPPVYTVMSLCLTSEPRFGQARRNMVSVASGCNSSAPGRTGAQRRRNDAQGGVRGRPWTQQEDVLLRELAAAGKSVLAIAVEMNRSEGATSPAANWQSGSASVSACWPGAHGGSPLWPWRASC
jgi:hypothetical protein